MDELLNTVSKEISIYVVFDPEEWMLKLTINNTESPSQTFRAKMGQYINVNYTVDIHMDNTKDIKDLGRTLEIKM